jgi:hypothetical protein
MVAVVGWGAAVTGGPAAGPEIVAVVGSGAAVVRGAVVGCGAAVTGGPAAAPEIVAVVGSGAAVERGSAERPEQATIPTASNRTASRRKPSLEHTGKGTI